MSPVPTPGLYQHYWDPERNASHRAYAAGRNVIVRSRDLRKIYRADTSEPVQALRGVTM